MHLYTDEKTGFELTIERYESPELVKPGLDEWEAHHVWLIINGNIHTEHGSWGFEDACLETSEVVILANWLEAVGEGTKVEPYLVFAEPNLEFELLREANSQFVRIFFSLECNPPDTLGLPRKDRIASFAAYLDIPVDDELFASAANSVRTQFRHFDLRMWERCKGGRPAI